MLFMKWLIFNLVCIVFNYLQLFIIMLIKIENKRYKIVTTNFNFKYLFEHNFKLFPFLLEIS